jgi:hypothetical protein
LHCCHRFEDLSAIINIRDTHHAEGLVDTKVLAKMFGF